MAQKIYYEVLGMDALISKHWHYLPADEIIDLLDSDSGKGLDLFEVDNRQKEFGPNVITGKKGKGPLLRFLLQFHQPLIYILVAAGSVTAFLQEWVDAGVIFGVVLVNAFIGFIQEVKAVKAIEALAGTMTTEATVLRAGEKQRISSVEVVPGDIVLLQSGDKVPADMRLFQARDLQVDESALTGESVPGIRSRTPSITIRAWLTGGTWRMHRVWSLMVRGSALSLVLALKQRWGAFLNLSRQQRLWRPR